MINTSGTAIGHVHHTTEVRVRKTCPQMAVQKRWMKVTSILCKKGQKSISYFGK